MDTKEYERLLEDLGIAKNKTAREAKDILEIKLNEFIDIQNDEMIDRVTEAIDFAEEQMDVLDTGIALVEEAEETSEDFSELKGQGNIKRSTSLGETQGTASSVSQMSQKSQTVQTIGTQQNPDMSDHLWFHSISGTDSINVLFAKAVDELKYKQWETAKRIFDSITNIELHNPGAFLGKLMAEHHIAEIDNLYTTNDSSFEKDTNLQRAYDYGNDQQKEFIRQLREERDKKWNFEKAIAKKNKAKTSGDYVEAAKLFDALGDYATAKKQAENCKTRADEMRKHEIEQYEQREQEKQVNGLVKQLKDASDIRKAEELYKQLENMNSGIIGAEKPVSEKKLEECKAEIQRRKNRENESKASKIVGIVGIILCLVLGIPFNDGIWGYLPAQAYSVKLDIEDSSSPYLISFGVVNSLDIYMSKTEDIIMPLADLSSVNISYTTLKKVFKAPPTVNLYISSCGSVEKLYLDEKTTLINISSCEKLTEIYVTENIKDIEISSCPNVQIIWPEGFDNSKVHIEGDIKE